MTGFNLFAYCGNNPVNRIDPNGQAWYDAIVDFVEEMIEVVESIVNEIISGSESTETSSQPTDEPYFAMAPTEGSDAAISIKAQGDFQELTGLGLPEDMVSIKEEVYQPYEISEGKARFENTTYNAVLGLGVGLATSGVSTFLELSAGTAIGLGGATGVASNYGGEYLLSKVKVGMYYKYNFKIITTSAGYEYNITIEPDGSTNISKVWWGH